MEKTIRWRTIAEKPREMEHIVYVRDTEKGRLLLNGIYHNEIIVTPTARKANFRNIAFWTTRDELWPVDNEKEDN